MLRFIANFFFAIGNFFMGIHYHIPWCCSVRWCLDLFSKEVIFSGYERGNFGESPNNWVPCEWFHFAPDYPATAEERKAAWKTRFDEQMKSRYHG
jgi:hypothetical protein